jgi:hypothetical protein
LSVFVAAVGGGEEADVRVSLASASGLHVEAMSPHIVTSGGLTRERFRSYMQGIQPHYSVDTNDPVVVQAVAEVIAKAALEALPDNPDRVDVRYALRFDVPKVAPVWIYADSWGYIVLGNKVYKVKNGETWVRSLWKAIGSEPRYTRARR